MEAAKVELVAKLALGPGSKLADLELRLSARIDSIETIFETEEGRVSA